MAAIGFFGKRLIGVAVVVISVSIFMFVLLRSIPGDPARLLAGFDAPPEVVEQIKERYGLNDPLPVQLIKYLENLFTLNLGTSVRTDSPVIVEILHRLPYTLYLSAAALFIAVAIGVPLGAYAALKKDSPIDYFVTALISVGTAMPTFWLGLMLILLFSVQLKLLPAGGAGNPSSIILPAITLSLPVMAPIAKTTRFTFLEVLKEDFVKLAVAKGLRRKTVIFKHVMKNAMVPVVTVLGLQLGNLMKGAVITETVFAWPGIGRLVVDSIFARDYPMVQGAIFVLALIYALINLAVDSLYAAIDPRIRLGGAS
ncbi:MAG: ABC transporter permease subunit [Desulfurococcales archaeon]|jgi:peptide/nickel transport system permease protein/oligopeptide transport system permease protein|nr:ABC transporter permease [Thermoprotei archaeon]NAY90219.1 ABC transporter permease subunit [Desulfurococcales archaeon]